MIQNLEIIISKGQILIDTINSNLSLTNNTQIKLIRDESELKIFTKDIYKITTLIVENYINQVENLLPNTQNIINLTDHSLSNLEIKFKKPLKLSRFITNLNFLREQYDEKIFCIINNNFIFDAKAYSFSFNNNIIKLTDKETEIVKLLIKSPDFSLEKSQIFQRIWHSKDEADTYTIETHISKLKQKLPFDFISTKNNIYSLNINNIL